jgi:hypothetical protein
MSTKTAPKPTQTRLKELGLSQAYASELAAGKKIPSWRTAKMIEEATGYPMASWKLGEIAQ